MIEIKTKDLQNKLNQLAIGAKNNKYLFCNNGYLTTNSFGIRVDVELETDLTFCVFFPDFYKYIKALKTETIILDINEEVLTLKSSRRKSKFVLAEKELCHYPREVQTADMEQLEVKEQFDDFIGLISKINHSNSQDLNKKTVFFSENKLMFSDGVIMLIKKFDKSFGHQFGVEMESLKKLKGYEINSFAFDDSDLVCIFDGGRLIFKKIGFDNVPDFDRVINGLEGFKPVNFPAEVMDDIKEFDSTSVISIGDTTRVLKFNFTKDFVIVSASNHMGETEVKYKLESESELEFKIDSKYLIPKSIIENSEVEIVKGGMDIIKFENEIEKLLIIIQGRR